MFKSLFVALTAVLFASCASTNTFYVVRHAEKESANSNMTSDVPLSAAGMERAEALKELLRDKKIELVLSTNYKRTIATGQPVASQIDRNVHIYDPRDSTFLPSLKKKKVNILIVGHSNTVDDIVNAIMGSKELSDLPESQYGDLFILKRKGSTWTLQKSRFGN